MYKRTIPVTQDMHHTSCGQLVTQHIKTVEETGPLNPLFPIPMYTSCGLENIKKPNIPVPPETFKKERDETVKAAKSKYEGESYTTFAGCDIKAILVPHSSDATAEEYVRLCKDPHDSKNRKTLGQLQAISCLAGVFEGTNRIATVGMIICIQFDQSAYQALDGRDQDLVLLASNEYRNLSVMVLPNLKIVQWRWGIAIDDLVSEEVFEYEAEEPIYWTRI